jgi:hypothetical protein
MYNLLSSLLPIAFAILIVEDFSLPGLSCDFLTKHLPEKTSAKNFSPTLIKPNKTGKSAGDTKNFAPKVDGDAHN